jgi:hypothetical protein
MATQFATELDVIDLLFWHRFSFAPLARRKKGLAAQSFEVKLSFASWASFALQCSAKELS